MWIWKNILEPIGLTVWKMIAFILAAVWVGFMSVFVIIAAFVGFLGGIYLIGIILEKTSG